ncbi:MAG: hypothetical protein H6510_17915 [Acidobacteria bacterium]|nr:hypothetical protein [Acidobacteriota bacterium]MCB9399694.1 hypothetical protein [Acidobacteriota bacterium]
MVRQWLHNPRFLSLFFVGLILLAACIFVFGVQDEQLILADQSGTVNTSRLSLQRTQKEHDSYQTTLTTYETNRKQISSFRNEFLRQKDERIIEISRLLHQLAAAHSIQLDQVRYTSQPLANQNLGLYRIDFPAAGPYADLRKFISDLENSPLLLMITQLEMEDSNQFQGSVRAKFRLATFFEEASQ